MFGRFKKSKSNEAAASQPQLSQSLAEVKLPHWPDSIPQEWVTIDGQEALLTVPFAADERILEPLQQHPKLGQLKWTLKLNIAKLPNSQPELPMTFGNVIVVSSGKGGVG